MATARTRKRRTAAAMSTAALGWSMVIPPDPDIESADMLRQLIGDPETVAHEARGVPLTLGELGRIDCGFRFITS